MNPLQRGSRRAADRQGVGRAAVFLLPNGFTLFNLFCGIYAIVLAIRGQFASAPSFIVLGGIADALDGRVARATGTGSRFGEELDSLVDAITFGFAPPLIVYLGANDPGIWEWLLVFIFTACAVMRLARFNVEQAGRKKNYFHGLPSPAAGLTLATYYWFAQTPLYNQTVILFTDSKTLSDLPWQTILRGLMAVLAALMISDVPYPAVPSMGFNSVKRILGTLAIAASVVLLIVRREEFIFPALLAYVAYGAIKWVILGFLGRSGTPAEIFGGPPRREPGTRPPEGRRTPTPRSIPGVPSAAGESSRDERLLERTPARTDERRGSEGAQPNRRKRRRRRGGSGRPPGSNPSAPPSSAPPPSAPPSSGPAE